MTQFLNEENGEVAVCIIVLLFLSSLDYHSKAKYYILINYLLVIVKTLSVLNLTGFNLSERFLMQPILRELDEN